MDIKTLIRSKQAILAATLDTDLSHPSTKGSHSEEAWIKFFRSFLPQKYAIDKGFVFDSFGKKSDQIDIVIYDALYAPLIFTTEGNEKYITAESVYAIFECKPLINKDNLEYANMKIESVRQLHRTARAVINAGRSVPCREHTTILGGILATSAILSDNIRPYLNEYRNIDMGCAIKSTAFVAYRDREGRVDDCQFSSDTEILLAFFYIVLDELYKLGTVAGLDIRSYADATLDSIELRRTEQ